MDHALKSSTRAGRRYRSPIECVELLNLTLTLRFGMLKVEEFILGTRMRQHCSEVSSIDLAGKEHRENLMG